MTAQPGSARTLSNTDRPADKGATHQQLDPAAVRRSIDALVEITGCRRKEARERVRSWASGGTPSDDLEAWLRADFQRDPVGVTAVRNVDREQARS